MVMLTTLAPGTTSAAYVDYPSDVTVYLRTVDRTAEKAIVDVSLSVRLPGGSAPTLTGIPAVCSRGPFVHSSADEQWDGTILAGQDAGITVLELRPQGNELDTLRVELLGCSVPVVSHLERRSSDAIEWRLGAARATVNRVSDGTSISTPTSLTVVGDQVSTTRPEAISLSPDSFKIQGTDTIDLALLVLRDPEGPSRNLLIMWGALVFVGGLLVGAATSVLPVGWNRLRAGISLSIASVALVAGFTWLSWPKPELGSIMTAALISGTIAGVALRALYDWGRPAADLQDIAPRRDEGAGPPDSHSAGSTEGEKPHEAVDADVEEHELEGAELDRNPARRAMNWLRRRTKGQL